MTIDTTDLETLVEYCFAQARNTTLSDDSQNSFLNLGQHLRNDEMNALAAQFDDGDARVAALNTELSALATEVSNEATTEASYAATIAKITQAVNVLDKILVIAAKV
jgi:hypothetical protein